MNKLEINPYDGEKCRVAIEKYLPSIYKKFGEAVHLSYDRSYVRELMVTYAGDQMEFNKHHLRIYTPRGFMSRSIFSCAIFYYLEILLANNPSLVMDIGCGDHTFKDIIPGLYGVDPFSYDPDSPDGNFNAEYAAKHAHEFECAMALVSLHFISLLQFKNQIELFSTILKPGGRGLLTLNAIRMVECTTETDLMDLFGTTEPTPLQVEEYIDQELKKINLNFLVMENIVSDGLEEWMDGNIRLVFEV